MTELALDVVIGEAIDTGPGDVIGDAINLEIDMSIREAISSALTN
jgi:hypothetical protein